MSSYILNTYCSALSATRLALGVHPSLPFSHSPSPCPIGINVRSNVLRDVDVRHTDQNQTLQNMYGLILISMTVINRTDTHTYRLILIGMTNIKVRRAKQG